MSAKKRPIAPKPLQQKRFRLPDSTLLRVGLAFLVLLAGFLTMNASYFSKQVSYALKEKPEAVDVPAAEDPVMIALSGQPDRLSIPALGIEAPLIYIEEKTQKAYKKALQDGVVHFPETAEPGQPGNAYFFGHSSDLPWASGDFKTVFALLPRIEAGTHIYLTDRSGNVFTYAASSTKIVTPDDLSVLDQSMKPKRTLTLQTSYPVGTALRRFIVTAELEASRLVR
jgi:LPXTG-site transpeptidase (sortase) family protein